MQITYESVLGCNNALRIEDVLSTFFADLLVLLYARSRIAVNGIFSELINLGFEAIEIDCAYRLGRGCLTLLILVNTIKLFWTISFNRILVTSKGRQFGFYSTLFITLTLTKIIWILRSKVPQREYVIRKIASYIKIRIYVKIILS